MPAVIVVGRGRQRRVRVDVAQIDIGLLGVDALAALALDRLLVSRDQLMQGGVFLLKLGHARGHIGNFLGEFGKASGHDEAYPEPP